MLLGFIFGLDTTASIFLILCIVAVCLYEAINGFHDTANAVATVIYTKTLKPNFAVIWSGIWNFLGVFAGGLAVAMGMIKMLPLNDLMATSLGENIALVLAILFTAIVWNLGTWYFGIPCSSSHTMIGALLGGGFAFYNVHGGSGVNWAKAQDVGLSLLFSPVFGFSMAILLMFLMKTYIKKNKAIFKEPDPKKQPPTWIRVILITTCTLVSFFHGSNDGQKGVGLMLVVLIAFMPMQFALDTKIPVSDIRTSIVKVEEGIRGAVADSLLSLDTKSLLEKTAKAKGIADKVLAGGDKKDVLALRKQLQTIDKEVGLAIKSGVVSKETGKVIKSDLGTLKSTYEFAPIWVLILISLSLGIGTMIGWKRIVVTIGEKIGKSHLTYAQGASAELIASMTIGLSTYYGLPVSTTHVLSSGVAGSMVASGGVANLRKKTITNIALAWILTLPVTFVSAALMYLLFRMLA